MKSYALFVALSLLATACAPARPERTPPAAAEPASSGPAVAVKTEPTGRWDAQRGRGVDFVAMGSEPFWSLELTKGQMRFRTVASGDSIRVPLPTPSQAQDAPVLRYRAQTAAGELTVTIAQRSCTNNMSGEVLPYTVTVQVRTTAQLAAREFAGCGRYLGDYRLHDIWALESIDGQAVDAAQFATKDKPYLELNLTREEALGFGGCNGFGGSLTPERAGLKFGTLRGTMLACPALPFERRFLGALSGNSFAYRLENRRLTLENRINQLVFKKVD